MSRLHLSLLATLGAFAVAACGDDDPTGGEPVCTVSNVAITGAPQSITIGNLGALTVEVTATDCDPAPVVTWTSSNTNFATVSNSGVVTGIAAGNVTITASAGGKSSNVPIQIVAGGGGGPIQ